MTISEKIKKRGKILLLNYGTSYKRDIISK